MGRGVSVVPHALPVQTGMGRGLTLPLALFTFLTVSAITSLSLATAWSFWYLVFCVSPRYSPWKGCCRLGTEAISQRCPVHCPPHPPTPAPFGVECLLVLEELTGAELGLQQGPALWRQLLPVLLALPREGVIRCR